MKKEVIHITEKIIIVDNRHYHHSSVNSQKIKIIQELTKEVLHLTKIINHLVTQDDTQLVLIAIINNSKFKIMSATLKVEAVLDGMLGLVNRATQQPIDTTFENETFSSDDESIFTTSEPVDDEVEVLGVSVGSANLTVTADCTYADPNTGNVVTKSKSATIPVEVTAADQADADTDLVVNFPSATPGVK